MREGGKNKEKNLWLIYGKSGRSGLRLMRKQALGEKSWSLMKKLFQNLISQHFASCILHLASCILHFADIAFCILNIAFCICILHISYIAFSIQHLHFADIAFCILHISHLSHLWLWRKLIQQHKTVEVKTKFTSNWLKLVKLVKLPHIGQMQNN